MALVVGAALAAITALIAIFRVQAHDLLIDPMVARALGATVAMGGVMISRVALAASTGWRRITAISISTILAAVGISLVVMPGIIPTAYDRGLGIAVPWAIGVPAILCLMLSRWRVS